MSIFVFLVYRDELSEETERHENIHFKQGLELGFIFFWFLYFFFLGSRGYDQNPFEEEAFENHSAKDYLNKRKHYAWVKYL
ncbi:MAG: hypothetical protein ACK5QX_00445 [bacterium]